MKKIKIFSSSTLLIASLAIISSCGNNTLTTTNNQTSEPDLEVDKFIRINNNFPSNTSSIIDDVITSFETKYPQWKVETNRISNINDLYNTNRQAIKEGSQCNISYCCYDNVASYIENYNNGKNAVLDLSLFMNSTDKINNTTIGYTKTEMSDFIPAYYDEGKALNIANYSKYGFDESSVLSLPFLKSSDVMLVNMTKLESVGISETPQTWDDLWTACEKLKTKYPNSIPFALNSESNFIIDICKQNNWDYTSTSEPYYKFKDNDNICNFLDSLKTYYTKGLFTTSTILGSYAASDLFKNGNDSDSFITICSSSAVSYTYNDYFDCVISSIPGTRNSNGIINNSVGYSGGSLCMFDCKNKEKNTMSWLFLKELLEPEIQAKLSELAIMNPSRLSSYNVKEYSEYLSTNSCNAKTSKIIYDKLDSYYASPCFVGSLNARTYIGGAVVAVINGSSSTLALTNAYNNCISNK